jgi:hypothetical protein
MLYTAEKQPAVFFATCARLLPNDVRVTVEQSLPGNLSPSDWHLMLEVVEAVKAAIPDAGSRAPGAVLEHVLDAVRNCPDNNRNTNGSICSNEIREWFEWVILQLSGEVARQANFALRDIMIDEEEFAARSQLKWTREGDAWILLCRRRRMGRVVPDTDHPGIWRSTKLDGTLSDVANLSWSKDAVLAQAAREVAYERANTPSKPQQNRGSFRPKSSLMRLNAA